MKGFEITCNGRKSEVAVKEGLLTIHINDVNENTFEKKILNIIRIIILPGLGRFIYCLCESYD